MGRFHDYYTENEMVTVIVPDGFDVGKYICVYFQ